VELGHSGVLRSTISCQLTRSCCRSTAGGTEVNDAAAKKMVMPMPISTSAKRRSRLMFVSGRARSRSTSRKFIPPRPSSISSMAILAQTITP
jgi:hypothetical protein